MFESNDTPGRSALRCRQPEGLVDSPPDGLGVLPGGERLLDRAPAEAGEAEDFIAAQESAYRAAGRPDAAAAALADFCQVLLGLNETLHIE